MSPSNSDRYNESNCAHVGLEMEKVVLIPYCKILLCNYFSHPLCKLSFRRLRVVLVDIIIETCMPETCTLLVFFHCSAADWERRSLFSQRVLANL